MKDKATKETFTDEETERVLYGFLSKALYENGLYCRADDRGDPVVQLAPAADLRPVDVRRDRGHSARRAHGGVDEALTDTTGCRRQATPVVISYGHTRPGYTRSSENGGIRAAYCPDTPVRLPSGAE